MENEDNYKENYEIMDIDEIFNKLETPSENNIIYNIFNLISILNDKIYCFIENNQIYKINQEENIFEKIPSVPIIKEYNRKPINIVKEYYIKVNKIFYFWMKKIHIMYINMT